MSANQAAAPYKVFPYTPGVLVEQLSNKFASAATVGAKRQVEYLQDYLSKIDAKTVLVEHSYVDRDYMEDFAAYYVRCFADYERRCRRLHFFKKEFSETDIQGLISSTAGDVEQLQDSYLGFIAVKPLPDTVIGRTCLVTYPDDGERRYEITRDYDANLFGIPLRVRRTLAFQEQDRVVAACASSALWSAFHGTSKEFSHRLLSPAEITASAGAKASDVDRNLPSRGLTWSMMADAIRYVGLEPLYLQPADDFDLKATIYGYLRGGIPAVLGWNVFDPSDEAEEWKKKGHAVTVAGFRIPEKSVVTTDKDGFRLAAYRVDRIFVHDDQVGPFARMFFDGQTAKVFNKDGTSEDRRSLGTLYFDEAGNRTIRAIETVLLLPLYHKIRIPYSLVHDTVFQFWAVFVELLAELTEVEWDIYLTTGNAFKQELRVNAAVDPARKVRYLSKPLPRFLWRACARLHGEAVLDLLIDATDIEQGTLFAMVVEYDAQLAELMPQLFGDEENKGLFGDTPARRIVDWYVTSKATAPLP